MQTSVTPIPSSLPKITITNKRSSTKFQTHQSSAARSVRLTRRMHVTRPPVIERTRNSVRSPIVVYLVKLSIAFSRLLSSSA